jgi:hypothetical protein
MNRRTGILTAAALLLSGAPAMAIEQPSYRVIEKDGDFEIRQYESYLVVETLVAGEFASAGNEGFRRLFNYITGGNRARSGISMTAPVAQSSQEIAMTAPVNQAEDSGGYWISFVVPSQFTLDTVPQPVDPRVRVREVPGQLVAVLRYSGMWSEGKYQRKEAMLMDFIASRELITAGSAQFARYNPPFMPPFLRRNEIMMPLAGAPAALENAAQDSRLRQVRHAAVTP